MCDEEEMGNVVLHSHSDKKPRQAGEVLGVFQVEQELELWKEWKWVWMSVLLRSGLMAYDEELKNILKSSCYGSVKENNSWVKDGWKRQENSLDLIFTCLGSVNTYCP